MRVAPATVLVFILGASFILPVVAAADPLPVSRAHVRAVAPDLRALVEEAVAQSTSIRVLVGQLEVSDVVVYVRMTPLVSHTIDGRLGFLSSAGGHRYLVIELACGRPRVLQIATLGHELQHAAEIASAPEVVDAGSLATYYRRVGLCTSAGPVTVTFETEAAADVGRRVRQELLSGSAKSTNGS